MFSLFCVHFYFKNNNGTIPGLCHGLLDVKLPHPTSKTSFCPGSRCRFEVAPGVPVVAVLLQAWHQFPYVPYLLIS